MYNMIDVDALYRKYGPMVFRRCKFLLRDEEKALDAMQEVFVKLCRKQDVLHGTAVSSLLYRIATNTCLNVIRGLKRKPEVIGDEIIEAIAGYDDHPRITESRVFIDDIFEDEAKDTRTMATLHYVDGLTLEETAKQVGLSVSGVRKRLTKLKERCVILKEAYQHV